MFFSTPSPALPPPLLGPNQSIVAGKEPIVCGAISCGSAQTKLPARRKKKKVVWRREKSKERKRITQKKRRRRREGDCDFSKITICQGMRERKRERESIRFCKCKERDRPRWIYPSRFRKRRSILGRNILGFLSWKQFSRPQKRMSLAVTECYKKRVKYWCEKMYVNMAEKNV